METQYGRHICASEVELGEEWRTTWPPTTNRLALVMVLQLSLVAAMALLPESLMGPAQRTQTAKMPAVRSALHEVHTALLSSVVAGVLSTASVAHAIGPNDMNIGLEIKSYEEVTCPEALAQGRAGGALGAGAGGAGIAQKCVEVKAVAQNGSGKQVKDAGVFGVVYGIQDGMSVLGNGQDGKNDAGQFAMIDSIPPGSSDVKFIFVAQQSDDCVPTRKEKCPVQGTKPLVPLKFEKVKAISYPGGDRYKVYDECEQNEFAEGCE